jgi:hypothetical protein
MPTPRGLRFARRWTLIPSAPVIARRFKLAALSGGVVGAIVVARFGAMVRHEADEVAGRYGATVVIEKVFPTYHGVRLRGVDVLLAEVSGARIHLEEVEVARGANGRAIALHGGLVSAIGPREVVLRQVEAWRARYLAEGASSGAGRPGGGSAEVSGLRLAWQDDRAKPTEMASADDVRLTRADGRITFAAGNASVLAGLTRLDVQNGRLELVRREGGYRVGAISADSVEAQITVPGGQASAVPLGQAPPVPLAGAPWAQAPLAGTLRNTLLGAARAADLVLDPSAGIRIQGLHARVYRGAEVLNLGPGTLQIARADGRLVVELTPELRAASSPPPPASASAAPVVPTGPQAAPNPGAPSSREEALTLRLSVPLGEAAQEIVADIQGGPIWFSSIGVKEGDFGLFDVGRTSLSTRSHVVLSADGATARIDGEGKVHALSLRSAALSDQEVAGLELAFRAKAEVALDGSRARIDDAEVGLGAIRLDFKGEYVKAPPPPSASPVASRRRGRRTGADDLSVELGARPAPEPPDSHRFRGTFDVPLTACQAMLDATPRGLVPKLQGMRLAGSFALRGRADIDTANPDRSFHLDWDTQNACRIIEASAGISVDRFRRAFRRTAYDPEGHPVSLETGPGTPAWVPLAHITKFMEIAVLTTEDGGFHRHQGFDAEAIKNSIRENLRQKRFVRGASTVSMQLAKNLYLDRGKNLSRKLQEAVLTLYLEQALTKDQILELYLNVVEFGPLVYGIGPAARHYFNTTADELSLGQALYLSSILPNPKVQRFAEDGAVSPGWADALRRLMKTAHDRKRITDEELDEGLRETVVRGSPAPRRGEHPVAPGPESGGEPTPPTDASDD